MFEALVRCLGSVALLLLGSVLFCFKNRFNDRDDNPRGETPARVPKPRVQGPELQELQQLSALQSGHRTGDPASIDISFGTELGRPPPNFGKQFSFFVENIGQTQATGDRGSSHHRA